MELNNQGLFFCLFFYIIFYPNGVYKRVKIILASAPERDCIEIRVILKHELVALRAFRQYRFSSLKSGPLRRKSLLCKILRVAVKLCRGILGDRVSFYDYKFFIEAFLKHPCFITALRRIADKALGNIDLDIMEYDIAVIRHISAA